MQACITSWPPLLLEFLRHNGEKKVRQTDHVVVQHPCGCVSVCTARVLADLKCVLGNNHSVTIPASIGSSIKCPCCDHLNKSQVHRMAVTQLREHVRARCKPSLMLVEMLLEMRQNPMRADCVAMPVNARAWSECLACEVNPPGHFENPDARHLKQRAADRQRVKAGAGPVAKRAKVSVDQARDFVQDRDEQKSEHYLRMGLACCNVDAHALESEAACRAYVQNEVHAALQRAGLTL